MFRSSYSSESVQILILAWQFDNNKKAHPAQYTQWGPIQFNIMINQFQ